MHEAIVTIRAETSTSKSAIASNYPYCTVYSHEVILPAT